MPSNFLNFAGIALWLLSSIAALAYFAVAKTVDFDPTGQFGEASISAEFDQQIGTSFSTYNKPLNNSVFHISQRGCSCNSANRSHVAAIDARVKAYGFNTYMLDADDPILQNIIIPSTPAIVVFDQKGKLAYMGPYSSGLFCSSGAGLVDGFISMVLSNSHYGATIVADSQGCYCNAHITRAA